MIKEILEEIRESSDINLKYINSKIKGYKKTISNTSKGEKAVSDLYDEIYDLPYSAELAKMRKAIKTFDGWVSSL